MSVYLFYKRYSVKFYVHVRLMINVNNQIVPVKLFIIFFYHEFLRSIEKYVST